MVIINAPSAKPMPCPVVTEITATTPSYQKTLVTTNPKTTQKIFLRSIINTGSRGTYNGILSLVFVTL